MAIDPTLYQRKDMKILSGWRKNTIGAWPRLSAALLCTRLTSWLPPPPHFLFAGEDIIKMLGGVQLKWDAQNRSVTKL